MNARIHIASPFTRTNTVNVWGFDMEAEFDYEPGEEAIWSPIDRAHPGSPPNAVLTGCRVGGVQIIEMLTNSQREAIEEKLIEGMQ